MVPNYTLKPCERIIVGASDSTALWIIMHGKQPVAGDTRANALTCTVGGAREEGAKVLYVPYLSPASSFMREGYLPVYHIGNWTGSCLSYTLSICAWRRSEVRKAGG